MQEEKEELHFARASSTLVPGGAAERSAHSAVSTQCRIGEVASVWGGLGALGKLGWLGLEPPKRLKIKLWRDLGAGLGEFCKALGSLGVS